MSAVAEVRETETSSGCLYELLKIPFLAGTSVPGIGQTSMPRYYRRFGDETPRRRAVPFTEQETCRLIELYCANRSRYHCKYQSGWKSAKHEKDKLLEEWSQEMNSFGVAFRSKEQIEEKIRNEVKRVQRFFKELKEREEYSGPPGLGIYVRPLPSYLNPLVQLLTDSQNGVLEIEDDNMDSFVLKHEEEEQMFENDRKPSVSAMSILLQQNPSTSCGTTNVALSMRHPSFTTAFSAMSNANAAISLRDSNSTTASTTSSSTKNSCAKAASESPGLRVEKCSPMKTKEKYDPVADIRTILYEEQIKLLRIRQEEAAAGLELRRLLIEKAKLDLEKARSGSTSDASSQSCADLPGL